MTPGTPLYAGVRRRGAPRGVHSDHQKLMFSEYGHVIYRGSVFSSWIENSIIPPLYFKLFSWYSSISDDLFLLKYHNFNIRRQNIASELYEQIVYLEVIFFLMPYLNFYIFKYCFQWKYKPKNDKIVVILLASSNEVSL